MRFDAYSFGSIQIDGRRYDHDVVIDHEQVRKRRKAASKRLRDAYGHTPLSIAEDIPWECRRLVVGTGASGALPVTPEVVKEARRRGVTLVLKPTADAIKLLGVGMQHTNAVLHVTC